jgi:hypothetical protein
VPGPNSDIRVTGSHWQPAAAARAGPAGRGEWPGRAGRGRGAALARAPASANLKPLNRRSPPGARASGLGPLAGPGRALDPGPSRQRNASGSSCPVLPVRVAGSHDSEHGRSTLTCAAAGPAAAGGRFRAQRPAAAPPAAGPTASAARRRPRRPRREVVRVILAPLPLAS